MENQTDPIPYAPTDPWLLQAILSAEKEGFASLTDVVTCGDAIDHAILTFDEIDGGLARLARGGFVSLNGNRIRVLPLATELIARRIKRMSINKEREAIRVALGAPKPQPPFHPTPADPLWKSGLTSEEWDAAVEEYGQG